MRSAKVDASKLEKWIGSSPYNEALLVDEVPTRHSTIAKILNGSYVPSERMANRINLIMSRFPNGDPARAKEPEKAEAS